MLVSTTFTAPRTLADACLALTDTLPEVSLDVGEDTANSDNYRYTYFMPVAEQDAFTHAIATITGATITFSDVDTDIDYVALTRANFPPLVVGPFFVARNDEDAPAGLIKLDIMPNRAFGSGEHATTTGCLLAYTHLIEQGNTFEVGLDFGAGSGILAIAAAKQHGTPFLCIDNDTPSVAINAQNAKLNGVEDLIQCEEGDVPPPSSFNLVFANILLQPLLELAPALAACVAPGGSLILSGFTDEQVEQIAEGYKAEGMKPVWQHAQGGWVAQIWQHA